MGSSRVEPENGLAFGILGSGDSQFDPVFDGQGLGLTHSVDVSLLDFVGKDLFSVLVSDNDSTVGGDFEGFVVRSVLFGLLSHETYVGRVTHGGVVKLPVFLAVFDDGLVDGGVAPVGNQANDFLQFVVFVPHLSSVSDDVGHRSVDDNVGGHVQIGNSLGRVDHGQSRSFGVDLLDGSFDFFLLGVSLDFFVKVS